MDLPGSKEEQILLLHQIELKSQQFKELSRDERFQLFLKRLESSWTYQEKGYGQK